MHSAPIPFNESDRLAKLRSFQLLDTLPQQAFENITALASSICGTSIALISLVDADRQWFKSRLGVDIAETPRDIAFCAHAILEPGAVMVVEDARQDARFSDNPLVRNAPHAQFYAGAPIVTNDGFALGTVCVIDRQPRQLSPDQRKSLKALADLVGTLMEHEKLSQEAAERNSAQASEQADIVSAMVNNALDLKSFVDTQYTYRAVNKAYSDYWQRDRKDIEGKTLTELLGKASFETLVKPYMDRAFAGETVHFETPFTFPGKGERHMEVSYLPALSRQGHILGVVVRAHDIQQRVEREKKLRETVAMLEHKTLEQERFIHIVSHDLREPINTINNFVSLLSGDNEPGLSSSGKRFLGFVAAGGERMKTLLDDLLEFLRLERHAVDKRSIDLAHLVAEVRDDLSASLASTGGRVEFGHLPMAYGDPSLLRIALQNLVSNGLKFRTEGIAPVVMISASIEADQLKIAIRDNGIGMADDQTDRIFEMFQRLHTRAAYAGTGLGLSITRRIAELHDGRITVTSAPAKGSCFTLALPVPSRNTEEKDGHEFL